MMVLNQNNSLGGMHAPPSLQEGSWTHRSPFPPSEAGSAWRGVGFTGAHSHPVKQEAPGSACPGPEPPRWWASVITFPWQSGGV